MAYADFKDLTRRTASASDKIWGKTSWRIT